MSDWIYRLIGSPSLRLGQPGVEFGFAMNIAPWAWALIALGCAIFGVLAYRRTEGSFAGRCVLGALRAALLLLLVILLAGPRLIKPNETEEKDWVLVLTDRSASMAIADVPAPAGSSAKRGTREQQLRAAMTAAEPVFKSLAAERVVVHLGFDASAYDLPVKAGSALPELSDPAGRRTDLNRAIEQALRRGAARPISGIVLLTDGRTSGGTDEPTRALLRRLETEKIPIFTVPLGSTTASADLAVRRASAPRYAFVKDSVPVDIEVQRTGPATSAGEASVVELIDAATGTVLDTRNVTWLPPTEKPVNAGDPIEQTQRITLTTQPGSAGPTKWTVRIRPPASAGAPDMVDDNNTAELSIDLVDRPLRVAYFDGYPRWEYRYLKNLLVREHSASAAVMLLAPGKRYIQEGSVILDALPHTPEEWNAFDVIILGDVWPGVFTTEQLTQIKERVSTGGAGLIWIGGEGSTPGAYRSTPLNELLPFSLPENLAASHPSGLDTFDDGATITPTPAADRLGVLRLSDVPLSNTPTSTTWFPPLLSDPSTGWASLYWVQKIDPSIIKPTAETLAVATPEGGAPGSGRAALLTMRYGAGRVIYVATDEIWRWRYGRGEMYPERFWIQLVRLLGRESVARSGRPAILEVTPDHALVEQAVRVQITLLDQSLADSAPPSLRVKVQREGAVDASAKEAGVDAKNQTPVELTLTPEAAGDSAPGKKGGSRVYATTWIPTDSGRYRAVTDDPTLTSLATGAAADDLTARVDVWQSDDELRRPQTDHALLARLAEATGGKVLQPDQLGDLPRLLPNRKLKLAGEPELHTLWDTPLALLLAVILLTAEWVGRRVLRLA